jgi:hypothetical protein
MTDDMPGRQASDSALEHLSRAVATLATGTGLIRTRLREAEPHFGRAFESGELSEDAAQRRLRLRIGAGLVEGGDDETGTVAEAIELLSEKRAAEIAADILTLYQVVAGLRDDDGYGYSAR